ncbi:MAG: hypothetical protein VKM97_01455 [Cyanobacteriota bacterium]|nr:hypothetical protein [Cyanobacteriota bacterium]
MVVLMVINSHARSQGRWRRLAADGFLALAMAWGGAAVLGAGAVPAGAQQPAGAPASAAATPGGSAPEGSAPEASKPAVNAREQQLLERIRQLKAPRWRSYGVCRYDWGAWRLTEGNVRTTDAECGPENVRALVAVHCDTLQVSRREGEAAWSPWRLPLSASESTTSGGEDLMVAALCANIKPAAERSAAPAPMNTSPATPSPAKAKPAAAKPAAANPATPKPASKPVSKPATKPPTTKPPVSTTGNR